MVYLVLYDIQYQREDDDAEYVESSKFPRDSWRAKSVVVGHYNVQ